jgi:hypothetical protein
MLTVSERVEQVSAAVLWEVKQPGKKLKATYTSSLRTHALVSLVLMH